MNIILFVIKIGLFLRFQFEDNVLQQQIRFYSSRLDKSLMRKLSHEDAEEDEEEDLIQTN